MCYTSNRFVDRDMVLRYHWGFGVGHTYCHTQDSVAHSITWTPRTPPTRSGFDDLEHVNSELDTFDVVSHAPLDGFADLNHEFSVSELDELEWQLPDTGKTYTQDSDKRHTNKFSDLPFVDASASNALVHEFDDLGADLSLGELDALEWETESAGDGGSVNGHDGSVDLEDDSNTLEMYEMYGSDWDDCSDESN